MTHDSQLAAVVTLLVLAIILIVLFVWALYASKPFRVWTGGALAAFADGFIDGTPVGSTAGAGIAAADGQIHADFGTRHIAIEVAHILAIPFFTGLADVRAFKKSNPLPNIFSATPPASTS